MCRETGFFVEESSSLDEGKEGSLSPLLCTNKTKPDDRISPGEENMTWASVGRGSVELEGHPV